VTYRPISRQRPKYAQVTIEKVFQELSSIWSAPCPLLGNGSLNTFPQKQTRNNRRSIARQRGGKQALSTIQAVFSLGSVQNGYKRVEFRSCRTGKRMERVLGSQEERFG
jgi:hypothetical protein